MDVSRESVNSRFWNPEAKIDLVRSQKGHASNYVPGSVRDTGVAISGQLVPIDAPHQQSHGMPEMRLCGCHTLRNQRGKTSKLLTTRHLSAQAVSETSELEPSDGQSIIQEGQSKYQNWNRQAAAQNLGPERSEGRRTE
jgi:hypothetical protein